MSVLLQISILLSISIFVTNVGFIAIFHQSRFFLQSWSPQPDLNHLPCIFYIFRFATSPPSDRCALNWCPTSPTRRGPSSSWRRVVWDTWGSWFPFWSQGDRVRTVCISTCMCQMRGTFIDMPVRETTYIITRLLLILVQNGKNFKIILLIKRTKILINGHKWPKFFLKNTGFKKHFFY